MTLLRDVITIPERVTDSDFVLKLADGVANAGATIRDYVVTESLARNFSEALGLVGQAVETGRSQAAFLHGSFGAGKSHFMAVLHQILTGNPQARAIPELAPQIATADRWLTGTKVLPLTYHMLGARSVEEAVFSGYLAQIKALHPDAPTPALHRSDRLLEDAARYRADVGDEKFFERLNGGGAGAGSAAWGRYRGGWDAASYAEAAALPPGTEKRDRLVSDLTATLFSGAVHSGEYLDIDTGLAVMSQHAKSLGYDVVVLFLDELVLWLSQHLSNLEFVNDQGGKLAKFVESADARRPIPLVSFVARQRDLVKFLGPHVPGAEKQAFSDVFRYTQGRFQTIELEERNLPLIAQKRLLQPKDDAAKRIIDEAFADVSRRPEVWDTLRLGAQFEDAGIGSDEAVFRQLYPFSPALVATLVALSQALQRERTALKTMLRLLVARRDTLQVSDIIGVAELFDELVNGDELPDEASIRKHFETARNVYRQRLRPALLRLHNLTEPAAASVADNHPFRRDDRLVKTLLLGALVPDVPALTNLTPAKLHALNYGNFRLRNEGREPEKVLERLREIAAEAPEIRIGDGPNPVTTVELSEIDVAAILDRVPATEDTPGARRKLLRELICEELGIKLADTLTQEVTHAYDWRGRRHTFDVVFGNVRDPDELPEATLRANGDTWKIVIDYPFDSAGHSRNDDIARVEALQRAGVTSRTVFWLPLYLTEARLGGVGTLVRLNYILAGTGDDRLYSLASDLSPQDRHQARVLLEQQQRALKERIVDSLKQAYGAAAAQASDVEIEQQPIFWSLESGLRLQNLVAGTLKAALEHLTKQVLQWSYPGTPNLPETEPPVRPAEARKVLDWIRKAVAEEARGVYVDQADRNTVRRICNNLQLGLLTDNRYEFKLSTNIWSQHLIRYAAEKDHHDRFPVRLLREALDKPDARGFDRIVQNLIIAAFALDQDLGWYQHETQVTAPPLEHITDDYELRHPPLPDVAAWDTAVPRAATLFGLVHNQLLTATNVADLAAAVRDKARAAVADSQQLVRALERHATVLGLDPAADTGRLATARRVAAALNQLSGEANDVVLVELLASLDLGTDDITASRSVSTARAVHEALARTQWSLLESVGKLADGRAERGRAILDRLTDAARAEQFSVDLVPALDEAVTAASRLLAETPIAPAPSTATVPAPTLPTDTAPPPASPAATPAGATVTVAAPARPASEAAVTDQASLDRVTDQIATLLKENPGATVYVSWRIGS